MKRGAADTMTIVLAFLTLLAAGTGGYTWMLYGEAQNLEKSLPQDEKNLKTAINLRDDLQDIKNRGGGVGEDETETIQSFFYATAKEHKIEIIRYSTLKSTYRNQWDEIAYTLDLSKGVSRQQLGNFMADVQLKKPFLKSKEIRDAKFDEKYEDGRFISSVIVVFSHFSRIKK